MRKTLFLILFVSGNLFSQNFQFHKNKHIYDLEEKIREGDFKALLGLVDYFDSKKPLTEFLGHHIINTDEASVAKRIFGESTFFLASEMDFDSTMTPLEYKKILTRQKKQIAFSELTNAFLITPFHKRETEFEILELTEGKSKYLAKKRTELLNSHWVKEHNIDKLLKEENSFALLKLASVLMKTRYWNSVYDRWDIVELIQLLTKTQIAVPDETGKLNYHIEDVYEDTPKVNLLIFFSNHYKDYQWDEVSNSFVNRKLKPKKTSLEKELFDLLLSENDTVAINAFIELTQSNPERVITLANRYGEILISNNFSLPTFEYRFLEQLVQLTDYCKVQDIDFQGKEKLKNKIELLKSDLSYSERRKLEDDLIDDLTLENITAFEYWSLIFEKNWDLTYSAGRILDKFYSKNWGQLIQNQKYLKTYLLKSKLFTDLGIHGFCNKYLIKFTGSSKAMVEQLNKIQSPNQKIQSQLEKAKQTAQIPIVFKKEEKKDWAGNTFESIADFDKSFKKIFTQHADKDKRKNAISFLLSQIEYNQIGQAFKAIDTLRIEPYYLYSFMERDFGFSFIGDFGKADLRKEFLENYFKYNERQLYSHYLKAVGIEFINSDGTLDFDKTYEILKFDLKTALSGGGGSTLDNGVYAIIKILELNFKTTLEYPNKLCCSNNTWACDSRGRAKAWMNYMEVNQLLKRQHTEPVSFAYTNEL